jgi:4-hydroxy-3-methylbut-2-enyl diphosphate reductase
VGVTAGASAPEVLVQQVVRQLQQWGGQAPHEIAGREENIVFSLPRRLRVGRQMETVTPNAG